MPLTATFAADPKSFCSTYSILVVEPPAQTQAFRLALNQHQNNVVNPAIQIDFTVDVSNIRGCRKLELFYAGAPGTARPCFFLPYLPDGATTMTLGGPPDLFFTSTLSGCSVRVNGPANAPTVTHANARSTFLTLGAGTAQVAINGVLPAAGAGSGTVTRADYHAKVTRMNTWVGKAALESEPGEFGTKLSRNVAPSGGYEVGCFVFGVRKGGNWKFYYQSTVGVQGTVAFKTDWSTYNTGVGIPNAEIVLGNPVKFFG